MRTVVLIATLDTKHEECAHLQRRLTARGCHTLVVDTGVLGTPGFAADVDRAAVAEAGGADLAGLAAAGDLQAAVAAMGRGAAAVVRRLREEERLDAVLALGGSCGTTIATEAMRALPLGVPKVMVSTMASGNTRPYVGTSDITMVHSVVDVAGLNAVSIPVLDNAAAATAGMVTAPRSAPAGTRPLIGASMIGLTTAAVDGLRARLEAEGYDVLVFHGNGSGGRSLEALASQGLLVGVADLTPTELADDLLGGVCSAGPDRLTAAGARGLPQVVSLGGLDMVMFGQRASVPARYAGRLLHSHHANVTLMRTSVADCAELGRRLARKLNAARGPVSLHLPADGLSRLSEPGGAFHDPRADAALVSALTSALSPAVTVHRSGLRLNDPAFGAAMADDLARLCRTSPAAPATPAP
ncbi:Tm-1-like ATP-binding domain-containing protein [Streptomyces odontomachi]|uniref:Tm-1-like ATP-binding domain-containing protein n=1 Tax=Streptomyces odontomachi TaxID=2944940 RepID=UPI0021087560|nr:Tm-1-like ATP-binding domain-containing protein [Streptomyces sp. ODS25]